MPRKSIAALTLLPAVDGRPARLRPRAEASATVRRIFSDLVASVPVEHFRPGDADLIEQLSQSIALARQAYAELEANGPVIDGRASPWNVVLEKAHRSSVALAARLRLCPQARTDPKTVGRQNRPAPSAYDLRPWEPA
jgi:hypothetical protein